MLTPFTKYQAVTPSDSVDLSFSNAQPVRPGTDALFVGTAGNVNVMMQDGTTAIFKAAAGTWLWISAKRVMATSTTATDIVAHWRV